MAEEKKIVELNDEDLKKVSGGDLYGFEYVDPSVPAPGKLYKKRPYYDSIARVVSFDTITDKVEFEICETIYPSGALNVIGNKSMSVYDFLDEYEYVQ